MPKMRFTDRAIKSLKTSEKQVDFWDENLIGFGIRVTLSGRKTWMIRYRIRNKKPRYSFGTYPILPLADARDTAKKLLYSLAIGNDPADKKQMDKLAITFEDLCAEYIERHAKKNKKSWRKDQQIINRDLKPAWGKWKAKDIQEEDVLNLIDKIKDRGVTVQANRTFILVGTIFNFGRKSRLLRVPNPCHELDMPFKERARDRVLLPKEIKKFWESTEPEKLLVRSKLRLRLLTGQRDEQLQQMELSELDLINEWWYVPGRKTKNGQPARVPLNKQALIIIRECIKTLPSDSKWLFHSKLSKSGHIGLCGCAGARVYKRCGFEIQGTDLRRTMSTYLCSKGVDRRIVKLLLHHASKDITDIYDQYAYAEERKNASAIWGNMVQNIIDGDYNMSDVIELRPKSPEQV